MTKPFIAITNLSTVWKDADIAAYVPSLQKHVSRDLVSVWGSDVDADIGFYIDHTAIPAATAWVIAVTDDSQQAGILGLHDITAAGLPVGYVFARTTLDAGEDPRTDLCHETDEMCVNPRIARYTTAMFRGQPVETVLEVCDAVEGPSYDIDGQPACDFVAPEFFDTRKSHPAGTSFDFLKKLSAPMTILDTGYLSVHDPRDGQGWRQVFGDCVSPKRLGFPPRRSRRERLFLRENHGRNFDHSTLI